MAAKQKPVYNAAGTHVFVKNSQSGDEWECPVDYLSVALATGFELTAPRDRSLDGLFDQTGFDPAEHTVAEVNDYLAGVAEAAPGEMVRVLELEHVGQNRKTIVDPRLAGTDEDTNPTGE